MSLLLVVRNQQRERRLPLRSQSRREQLRSGGRYEVRASS